MRGKVGTSRIVAVLEPRSRTMKLGVMKDQLLASLAGADRVWCYTKDLGWDAQSTLAPLGAKLSCEGDLDRMVTGIAADSWHGDHILVMSNGGFGGIHQKLLDRLRR